MRIVPGLLLAALLLPPAVAAHAKESFTVVVGDNPVGHLLATAGK